jgi:uncharacterized membrane protein YebE (DUF533 family)
LLFITEKAVTKKIVKKQRDESLAKDLNAVYANDVSLRQWDKIRRCQFGSYEPSEKKSHIGNLSGYTLDTDKALSILGSNKDLGNKMTGKWTQMAKDVGLKTLAGKVYNEFNSGQVR